MQLCGQAGLNHYEAFVLAMVTTMAAAFLWNMFAAGQIPGLARLVRPYGC
jgi:hypothetical protein